MKNYFKTLDHMLQEAHNAQAEGLDKTANGKDLLLVMAEFGDIDAVFTYAKENIITWDLSFTEKELDKIYDKANNRLYKFQNIYKNKKAARFFSDKELKIPCLMYFSGRSEIRIGNDAEFVKKTENAAKKGEPRAMIDLLRYYSTNGNITDSDNKYINYPGHFDWDEFIRYAICGLGFDNSPYYPVGYKKIFMLSDGVNPKEYRKKAYRILLKTLAFFADGELINSKEYKKNFGDFVPSEEQVMIARRWFFVEDERLAADSRLTAYKKEVAERIIFQVTGIAPNEEFSDNCEKIDKKSTDKNNTPTSTESNTAHKRIEMDNGDVYEGDYQNGKYHGQGTYSSHKGWIYVGKWKNGAMTDGKLTFSQSGNTFDGHFSNGVLHGHGKAVYYVQESNNYVYSGTYEGEWQNGKRHGNGKYTYADGTYYDGEWKDGEKHGNSVYTTKSSIYTLLHNGRWDMGKKTGAHDYYSITNPKKTVYRQFYENGEEAGCLFCPVGERKNWTAADAIAYKNRGEAENLQYWENKKNSEAAAGMTSAATSGASQGFVTTKPSDHARFYMVQNEKGTRWIGIKRKDIDVGLELGIGDYIGIWAKVYDANGFKIDDSEKVLVYNAENAGFDDDKKYKENQRKYGGGTWQYPVYKKKGYTYVGKTLYGAGQLPNGEGRLESTEGRTRKVSAGEFVTSGNLKKGFKLYRDETKVFGFYGRYNDKGRLCGKGIWVCYDGYYEGEFDDGMFHGIGTFCSPNGKNYVAQFEHNQVVHLQKVIYPDGKTVVIPALLEKEDFRYVVPQY